LENKFAFRRQYLVTPLPIQHSLFAEWKKDYWGNYCVSYHPDEHFTKLIVGNVEAIMFGFMVCPLNKLKTNTAIINDIISNKTRLADMRTASNKYCGRWALFIKLENEYIALNDPTAQKQIFYTNINEQVALSSSDHLLAKVFNYSRSTTVHKRFLAPYSDHLGHWLPGNSTLYDEVKCMITNHYISLNSLKVERFWPSTKVDKQNVQANMEKIHILLENYIDNFIERYPAALALTAGLDSRLLLAYFKKHIDKIFTYTISTTQKERVLDYEVPQRMAAHFGFKHILYKCNETPPEEFVATYKLNASFERELFRTMGFYLIHEKYPENTISVQAGNNELARERYGYRPYILRIKELVNMTAMGDNEFSREKFGEWLVDGTVAHHQTNVPVEDMFFLEQRLGRWHTNNRSEWDIAQDVFEPFNSRDLFMTIINLPTAVKHRFPNKLYEYLFSRTWPELYDFEGERIGRKFNLKKATKDFIKSIYYRIN
jgi:hypothetical protein